MSVSWGKEDSSFHAGGDSMRGKKAAELVGTILPRIPPLHFAYMAVFIARMMITADKALAGGQA